ncbi:hypothetical protein GTA51_04375 [Desulfovibrio aerotolerans]|uniref:Uncharacterized protein n=1 Tax=Solidesulfovibrio aerotolerans TaxID=295255 RepID=A0A7C9MU42_9BACT|nr:hypothetical protein [Solidesulfovibrio aerotolerans]MYL82374.1 hypothetical protein [Solidesulfovibrio aerotolerans]
MDVASLSLTGTSLHSSLLQTQKPGQTTAATAVAAQSDFARTDNMLSGNFVKTNFEQSKYLASRLDSYQTEKSFSNSMNSMLTDLTAQLAVAASRSGASIYVAATINAHKADKSVRQLVDQQVAQTSQASLDATRDDLEARAQAATDGSTATDATATGGEAAVVSTTAAVTASADTAAPATTGGETPTTQTPSAPTAAEAPAAPAAAPRPSIDIQV